MSTAPLPYYITAPGTEETPRMASTPFRQNVIDAAKIQAPLDALPAPSLANLNFGSSAPAVSAPALMPPVKMNRSVASSPNSGDSQILRDQMKQNYLDTTGSGVDQIQNPLLRGVARVGDIAASIFAPRLASIIPGTTLHHDMLVAQNRAQLAQDQAQQQAQLQQQSLQANIRHTNDESAGLEAPPAPEYDYVDTANGKVGILKGTTTAQPVTVNGQPVAPAVKEPTSAFELWHQQNPNGTIDDYNNAESKPLSQAEADSLNGIFDNLASKHGLPSGQFKAGMPHADALQIQGALNQAVGKQQGDTHITIQEGANAQRNANSGPMDTSDPSTQAAVNGVANGSVRLQDVFGRGASTAQKAAFVAAVKAVNPNFNSGDNEVENKARSYMISGQGGQTLNAGQTLTHHLDLYDKAVDAVRNGDVKTINAIGNELGVQMGNDAQTNLNLIRQGVAMEAARFYTGGVPGEAEINQFNQSLSGNGSPAQMHGGANTIRGMAAGKMAALQAQAKAGAQGKPNFDNGASQPETRIYQGHPYVKGANGWALQQQ